MRPFRTPQLFPLGQIVATRGAVDAVPDHQRIACLIRHATGDFGCVCHDDAETNRAGIIDGDRILSAYPIDPAKPCKGYGDNTLWIITEADRSVTTFCCPRNIRDRAATLRRRRSTRAHIYCSARLVLSRF